MLFNKIKHYRRLFSRFEKLDKRYLGFLSFRPPVPAYKHSAAMFLKLRGHIDCDDTHSGSPTRPDSDREILREIVERLPG